MAERQITNIRKDNGNHLNPNEAISEFKFIEDNKYWTTSRGEMVSFLESSSNNVAFVSSGYNKAYCYVRDNGRIKFIQTKSDGQYSNNLLSLPEF